MKVFFAFLAGAILSGFLTAYVGYRTFGDQRASRELRMTHAYLSLNPERLDPQLKEYLKSRFYVCVLDVQSRSDLFTGPLAKVDFGPIDSKVLAGVTGIKGPEDPAWIYHEAMRRVEDLSQNQSSTAQRP